MSASMALEDVNVLTCDDGEQLPLKIGPRGSKDTVDFLKSWIVENKEWLDQKLLEHGAILFQGFQVREAIEFQEVIQQYNPDLCDQYRGTSPRKQIPGTQYVFSASELPSFFPIAQHLEMAFLPAPPRKLFFCCLEAPTSAGGETCLADFRKVYEQMDPGIRQTFEEKGVMYIRNYSAHKKLLGDPTSMKSWIDVFETDDKENVEEELRKNMIDFTWSKNDHLHLVSREAAVEPHPVTGEKVWFNHAQTFHSANIPGEFTYIYKRLGTFKYWALSWLTWLLKIILLTFLGPSRVGFHTSYGDGSEIPESNLSHVRDTVWKNLVFNRWQQGDVLMIDNFRVSHGRQPYSGKRKIVVSWSQPYLKPSRRS